MTQRLAEQSDLEARANHDPLTGLLNRAALHALLDDRLARAVPTMVAYLDLDGFKAVNDTWGHERGDQLLAAVAGALDDACGPDDRISRLGGDEFVVVTDPGHSYEALGNRRDFFPGRFLAGILFTTDQGHLGRGLVTIEIRDRFAPDIQLVDYEVGYAQCL